MKKILVISSLIALALAGIAYAANVTGNTANNAWAKGDGSGNITITATGVGANLSPTLKVSANVCAYYAPFTGAGYALTTAHSSGTKSFASSAADNRIYMQENANKNGWLAYVSGATEPAKMQTSNFNSDGTNKSDTWTGWSAVK